MNQAGGGTRPQRRDANEAAPRSKKREEAQPHLLRRQSEATFGTKVFGLEQRWAGLRVVGGVHRIDPAHTKCGRTFCFLWVDNCGSLCI